VDLRILGWTYKNIRGMRELEVTLGSPLPRWSLIQMPNGTGKTTTLTLMRMALAEEPPTPEQVRSFRPDETTKGGEFNLRLRVDGENVWLYLKFDYHTGSLSRFTSRTAQGGMEAGLRLKRPLQKMLTPTFTKLFVFDGELAKSIRDISKDEAAKAISTLYRLDSIERLERVAGEILRRDQTANVSTDKGLSNLQGRLRNALDQLETLKSRKKELERQRARLEKEMAALQVRRDERISSSANLKQRLEEVNAKRNDIAKLTFEATEKLAQLGRNPAAVSARLQDRLHDLSSRLQKLKLPRTTSVEFFRELALSAECICGRSIGPHEKETIERRANEFLGEDQVGVINAMKDALRHSEADTSAVRDLVDTLKSQLRARQEVDNEYDLIVMERHEQGDEELDQIQRDLTDRADKLRQAERQLRVLTASAKHEQDALECDEDNNIILCDRHVRERQAALSDATNTMRLQKQTEYVQEVLEQVVRVSSDQLRLRVQRATNEKLKTILPGEQLRVKEIGNSLLLHTDTLTSKESVSEGQSLAVAYAFLASLFEDAPYNLPFVVDSPAVSLDSKVRREVAELIPNLFGQAIFFVISSERDGFAESFYDRPDAKFITVQTDRNGKTTAQEGITAFRSFHSKDDESARVTS